MIKYFTICSMIGIVIIYVTLLKQLIKRHETFENRMDGEFDTLPDKTLVYKEYKDGIVHKNFDNDLVKILKEAKDGDEITIPRHGIYIIHVEKEEDKTTITGIPS